MSILAIDQGRCSGWAFARPGKAPIWGAQRFKIRSPMREAGNGELGSVFQRWLRAYLINTHHPSHIVFETPYVGGGSAPENPERALSAGGFKMLIETICWDLDIPCWQIGTIEAVKALTGRGRFPGKNYEERRRNKKLATMEACWARGWRVGEDEADAIALLLCAESRLYPEAARSRPMAFKTPSGPLFSDGDAKHAEGSIAPGAPW